MRGLQAHQQYSVFTGIMLAGYNLADKLYGGVYIVLMTSYPDPKEQLTPPAYQP